MSQDWDTQEQCDLFDTYLVETADYHDGRRRSIAGAYGYSESEWEAFQFGWNAAKKHFGVTK